MIKIVGMSLQYLWASGWSWANWTFVGKRKWEVGGLCRGLGLVWWELWIIHVWVRPDGTVEAGQVLRPPLIILL